MPLARSFVILAFAVVLCAGAAPASAASRVPNQILILVDDMGRDWVGAYGSSHSTPNLDRLASEGVRFTDAWCTPVCTPTRVELLTGQYPFRSGWTVHYDVPRWGGVGLDPDRFTMLGTILRDAGCATAIAGKWQINDLRLDPMVMRRHGFDEHCLWTGVESDNPASEKRYWNAFLQQNGERRSHATEFGPDVAQHDWAMWDKDDACVRFRVAQDCEVVDCVFEAAAGQGVRAYLFARNIRIRGNTFRNLGAGGVLLCGYGPGTKDVNGGNKIVDNEFHDLGTLWRHSPAVFLWQSGENIVANNYIHDLPYNGIVLSGVRPRHFAIATPRIPKPTFPPGVREDLRLIRWREVGAPRTPEDIPPFSHTRGNIIRDNEIHDAITTSSSLRTARLPRPSLRICKRSGATISPASSPIRASLIRLRATFALVTIRRRGRSASNRPGLVVQRQARCGRKIGSL
ncbi:MAG: sulfatase-like hydrolase/transferase [Opitutaceae bacterium]